MSAWTYGLHLRPSEEPYAGKPHVRFREGRRQQCRPSTRQIPDGVTAIEEFAFVDEKGWERMLPEDEDYEAPLEQLAIPDGMRRIETYALAYCRNLTELSIPDGVAGISVFPIRS